MSNYQEEFSPYGNFLDDPDWIYRSRFDGRLYGRPESGYEENTEVIGAIGSMNFKASPLLDRAAFFQELEKAVKSAEYLNIYVTDRSLSFTEALYQGGYKATGLGVIRISAALKTAIRFRQEGFPEGLELSEDGLMYKDLVTGDELQGLINEFNSALQKVEELFHKAIREDFDQLKVNVKAEG